MVQGAQGCEGCKGHKVQEVQRAQGCEEHKGVRGVSHLVKLPLSDWWCRLLLSKLIFREFLPNCE